jgi:hypothetical protein
MTGPPVASKSLPVPSSRRILQLPLPENVSQPLPNCPLSSLSSTRAWPTGLSRHPPGASQKKTAVDDMPVLLPYTRPCPNPLQPCNTGLLFAPSPGSCRCIPKETLLLSLETSQCQRLPLRLYCRATFFPLCSENSSPFHIVVLLLCTVYVSERAARFTGPKPQPHMCVPPPAGMASRREQSTR